MLTVGVWIELLTSAPLISCGCFPQVQNHKSGKRLPVFITNILFFWEGFNLVVPKLSTQKRIFSIYTRRRNNFVTVSSFLCSLRIFWDNAGKNLWKEVVLGMLYGECYQASSTWTRLTCVFVVNSSRMKTSTTVVPWDGSYHECPAFVTSELVDGCALPHFEGNGEAAAREECDSSDFAVSRPWGYIIPVWWESCFHFPLYLQRVSWVTVAGGCIISIFLEDELPLICWRSLLPNSRDGHLHAEDFVCSEGSEAPIANSDLWIQPCSDPQKALCWLLGCSRVPAACAETEVAFLLLGWLCV